MLQRGIRGAITVDSNTVEDVKNATIELITSIKKANKFNDTDISYAMFTLTDDIDCIYPAKIVREKFSSWQFVPMVCVQESKIKNSLEKCLRILIVINTDIAQNDIKHVYLKGATQLRKDLNDL